MEQLKIFTENNGNTYQPKVHPDNTVIISPARTYTRDVFQTKMIEFLSQYQLNLSIAILIDDLPQ